MKFFGMLAIGLCLVLATPSLASETSLDRRISVTGTAETQVAPDLINWSVTLTEIDPNLNEAKRRCDESIDAILTLRSELGIAREDMESGSIRIEREYERLGHGERGDFKHFVVHRTIMIRQRDLDRFDEFLSAIVTSSDVEVSFQAESSHLQQSREEARLAAMRVARDKAAAMVGAVGAKLGPVLEIDEHRAMRRPTVANTTLGMGMSASLQEGGAPDLIPGMIDVSVTIYATFAIE